MVLLKKETDVDEKTMPFTHWWENLRREKHNSYEEKINAYLYSFQRWLQTPFFVNFMFPTYYQHNLLETEIYRNLQKLGNYTDEEVSQYATINPKIRCNLKATFGTPVPFYGLAAGAGLFAYMFRARFNLIHVAVLSLIPPIAQMFYTKWNIRPRHETLKFLEWDVENRKARSLLETASTSIDRNHLIQFKTAYPNKTVYDAYKDYLAYLAK